MISEDMLEEFLHSIEDWKNSKHLGRFEENTNISSLLNMKREDLKNLTEQDCLCYSYELYAYSQYVESAKTKEEIILNWAESSIWYIISRSMNQYGDKYTKWQEKYYSAIKENPLASDLLKIKNHAEARVSILVGSSAKIQNMAQILNNLSKRR